MISNVSFYIQGFQRYFSIEGTSKKQSASFFDKVFEDRKAELDELMASDEKRKSYQKETCDRWEEMATKLIHHGIFMVSNLDITFLIQLHFTYFRFSLVSCYTSHLMNPHEK